MLHFDIFTLFPGMFQGPLTESILKRAQERELLSIALHNIRDATTDKHHIVDDYPYGGGAGMVMKPEPIFAAVEAVYQQGPIILLSPQGRTFSQQIARELAQESHITLICGHYEGIDERVRENLVTDELSIGDYVLTGGELAAMVVVDAVSRLLPGVLAEDSPREESHSSHMLEYPQYTRPLEFRGWRVPAILLSGHHENVARWRRKEALRRTRQRRPDLFAQLDLSSKQDMKLLKELEKEEHTMSITVYKTAAEFLAKAQPTLERHETANSLMLGICLRLQKYPGWEIGTPYLATVEDEHGLISAACMTPPHQIVLYSDRSEDDEALALLIQNLRENGWPVPGAFGPARVAEKFATLWSKLTGASHRLTLNERLFELDHVIPPTPAPGAMQIATEDQLALVTDWLLAFHEEAQPEFSAEEQAEVKRLAARKISNGDIYLWELPDGTPVSLAGKTRPVLHTISIGPVYTPPEHRGKGYASNCVAALSQLLLDSGWQYCNLFTDLANPISNSIYQKIGYRPVTDYNQYRFGE